MPLEGGDGGNSTPQGRQLHDPELARELHTGPITEPRRSRASRWLCCWRDSWCKSPERCTCGKIPCTCATQDVRESSMPVPSGDPLRTEDTRVDGLLKQRSNALISKGTVMQEVCKHPDALISNVDRGTSDERATPQSECNSGMQFSPLFPNLMNVLKIFLL